MPELPIKVTIDAAALAALRPADSAEYVAELRALRAVVDALWAHQTKILLSRAEAAKTLGICERTIDSLGLPTVRIGTRVMFRRAALEDWCRQRETAAPVGEVR